MADTKPTFGIKPLPVEVVSQGTQATNNENKDLSKSKYWIIGGLVALGVVAYYIFKKK